MSISDLFDALSLESPGAFYDLAEFIAVGACTPEIARHRFRYQPDNTAGLMVNQLRQRRLLDNHFRPSRELADLIDTILAIRAAAATDLWRSELDGALRGASEALAYAPGKLANALRSIPEPAEPAHRLHHFLTGVRYARLDAHISAWEAAELTATEIVALSSAVTSEPVSPPPQSLVVRGWLTTQGAATAEGHAARLAIENKTNAGCDSMFGAVTKKEDWFATLRSLPPWD